MSWTNIGPFTELAPGQSVVWGYSWENNFDQGLQLAGPNFIAGFIGPDSLATLVASNQGKQLVGLAIDLNPAINYVVTITNTSNAFGWHNLQGGGVS